MLDVDKLHLSIQEVTSVMAHTVKKGLEEAAQSVLIAHNECYYGHSEQGALLHYYRQPVEEVGLYNIKSSEGFVSFYEKIGNILGSQLSQATHPEVFLKVVNDLFQNEEWRQIMQQGLLKQHKSLFSDKTYEKLINDFCEGYSLAEVNPAQKKDWSSVCSALRLQHNTIKQQAKEVVLSCDFLIPAFEEKLMSLCQLAEKFSCQSAPLATQSPHPLSSEVLIQSKRLESPSQPSQVASYVQRP